ncbi:carbonic anhydrase [Egibacter rhizosphaerae]|uniref:carbonic anhydrase n=1 Tax=Egibacter rhizosphaerae TaxID=1670831 RepID=A0A411YB83_9ACTN|nr:carbonic anhydrase [Egibacter rhizosphaerae]QBI18438.1 carbonic anhydrase [Egibacter rhizosphaerae]
MSAIDQCLANNEQYAAAFGSADLPVPPSQALAVVACMDARIDVYRALGLGLGDAHVIRNAGGVITEDAIRSLTISQRLLGTREVLLVSHTDCGMLTFRDDDVKDAIADEVGFRPPFAFEAFDSPEENLRQSIARIRASPFLPDTDRVRGTVYEVATGKLREVTPS